MRTSILLTLLTFGKADETLLFEQGAMTQTVIYTENDLKPKVGYAFSVKAEVLHGGKQEGTLLITATTPLLEMVVSPSRGMNIVSAHARTSNKNDVRLGWATPIQEIINPIYINQFNRNGSGFLEGFSETVVRCGFEWIGHAGDDNGEILTLHGLSSATPASKVTVEPTPDGLVIKGVMYQTATKQVDFKIVSSLTISGTGATQWSISDTLSNQMDYPHEYQALYHSNFGSPILGEGASVKIAASRVEPFNAGAVPEIDTWNTFKGQTRDYDETVYNVYPLADEHNMAYALLHDADQLLGLEVSWDTSTLPVFGLWKNTDLESRGYVAGLEPGTAFSYNRRFNRELGLVKSLEGKKDITFNVTYNLHRGGEEIKKVIDKITELQGTAPTTLSREPSSNEIINRDGHQLTTSLIVSLIAILVTTLY